MQQNPNLNIKKEKEKDETKPVDIINETLNNIINLDGYIKKIIKMKIKLINIIECIKIVNKINEIAKNISENLNKYNQDFEDEDEKYYNSDKSFETLEGYDNCHHSNSIYEYMNFCENFNDNISSTNTECYKCSICKNNESSYICKNCNQYFCEECSKGHNYHIMINIKEIENKAKKKKNIFLNSIEKVIKTILMMCNDLLNYEKINITNMGTNKDNQKNNYILREIKYPSLNKINDFESQLDFLKQLDEYLKDFHNNNANTNNTNNENNNSFYISKLNKQLIMVLENIFIDEDCNIFKDILKNEEYNYYDDIYDFEDENNENYFNIESNNSFYESIEYTNMSNKIQNTEDNNEYLLNKHIRNKNKYSDYFDKLKNKFYFSINLIPKKNYKYNPAKFQAILVNKINYYLSIDKDNIVIACNNGINFIDTFITTSKFSEMSIESIEENFRKFNKLKEFKILYNDLFCNEFNLREFLDYRGNFIIPDRSCNINAETEGYNPPYGWMGIGLNVIGKYEDDKWLCKSSEWAIAYHGVGRLCSLNEIKRILNNIIVNGGLIPGSSQQYENEKDKRHKGNIIGKGIYLTKDIKIAEEYSGIISFNSKNYKIVLMAKVLIDKIREPENYNYWILNNDDIRIYRILLKEII